MLYDNRKLSQKELSAEACNESKIQMIPFQKKWYYKPATLAMVEILNKLKNL